jgi:hypothetical protein
MRTLLTLTHRRELVRMLLSVFILFHAFAVLIGSVPRTASDPLSQALRGGFLSLVEPYLFVTAQWQRWELFGPDPVGGVIEGVIEVEEPSASGEGDWHVLLVLSPETLWGMQETIVLKILRMLSEDRPGASELRGGFLHSFCQRLSVPPGVTLRLRLRSWSVENPGSHHESLAAMVRCEAPSP